jgi:hypothetical protein
MRESLCCSGAEATQELMRCGVRCVDAASCRCLVGCDQRTHQPCALHLVAHTALTCRESVSVVGVDPRCACVRFSGWGVSAQARNTLLLPVLRVNLYRDPEVCEMTCVRWRTGQSEVHVAVPLCGDSVPWCDLLVVPKSDARGGRHCYGEYVSARGLRVQRSRVMILQNLSVPFLSVRCTW